MRSVLLGLFVLFQLLYLPLANLIQLVPREMPTRQGELDSPVQREGTATSCRTIQEAVDGLGDAVDRWGECSGQTQRWSLFAPDVGQQSCFPVIVCYCVGQRDFATLTIKPENAAESGPYCRWPSPLSRRFAYESLLAVIYRNFSAGSLAEHGDEWRWAVRQRVRDQQKSLEAYFRWNLALFQKRYPDEPFPIEMILKVLVSPAPKPGEVARPPSFEIPLARWFPSRAPSQEYLSVEAYDPVTGEFVRLPAKEAGP
jgi:hypothetical protein